MRLAQRVPRGLQERAAPLVKRLEKLVKEWEWTWTNAVIVALVLWIVAMTFIVLLPSWWLYFAQQKLKWQPCPCTSALAFWEFKARDVVASGLFGTPFLIMIVVPLMLQKWRRRLRGSGGDTRPTGGYR